MFSQIKKMFITKPSLEQIFLEENKLHFDESKGWVIDDVVLNSLSERLEYFSNGKLKNFDDLKALYFKSMLINEKIDLEIAHQRFVTRLGNTEENLLALKTSIAKLNQYYRLFLRDK